MEMEKSENEKLRKGIIGVLLPIFLLLAIVLLIEPAEEEPNLEQTDQSTNAPSNGENKALTLILDDMNIKIDIEEYLVGVLLGEMPASFEQEALRAQAVAARTYTLKKCQAGTIHGENTVCSDAGCCQAYTDPADYLGAGGSQESVDRIERVVTDTWGQVVVYEGELIMATYFSCAGDATEDAVAVWGQDYPYLRSVESLGEEEATYYEDSKTFSAEAFQKALGIVLEGSVDNWFGNCTYTAGGGVDTMLVCGIPYRGTTLRTLLGLRSTAFTVETKNGQITFHTKGFGHRVGLSQYGANAMAKNGKNYREILEHYYTGTEIVQFHYE